MLMMLGRFGAWENATAGAFAVWENAIAADAHDAGAVWGWGKCHCR